MKVRAKGARGALAALSFGFVVAVGGTGCGGAPSVADDHPVARQSERSGDLVASRAPAGRVRFDRELRRPMDLDAIEYAAEASASGYDSDYDGIPDEYDNCPAVTNADQNDADYDGEGDACEPPKNVDGRMTGGGSVFTTAGVRVTHGFQLRCHAGDERQNLEINWDGGQNFHLLDVTLSDCEDTELDERPPAAGFDTYRAEGTGRLNGSDGARVVLTFTDSGEPGVADTADVVIFDAAGTVVLDVSGAIQFGNHQAHRN